eukprot:CAMPEP_0115160346 /NCGR_PEP_ID=MMETSP0227-20121206/70755_1 /TAXON_ID=89957 /ORGANISM="Polarella glacialis, Strain CCMP 1383" /LENGTH=1360 /DNA_ID=CAMNT_0002572235 /DNA_START=111 /DNA_END=4191 /DNA_ORIENTATION=+
MWTANSKSDGAGPVVMSESQLAKLQERNKLLDILENQGQQIVVVGDTSSGKSTTINFLLGYPFNFVAQGIGTRRPCVMTLTPDPNQNEVVFRTRFQKNDFSEEREFTQLSDVANLVKNVNDPRLHPEWFDCLNTDQSGRSQSERMRPDDAFDETPVYVQLVHKDIDCPMRLVDVPGLSRGNRLTTQIALSFIKPDNAIILVIGKDHPNNGGFPHLAAAMRDCCRTLVIQNFANTKIGDNQVSENYNVVFDKMQGAPDVALYCIDYGLSYEPDLPLWQDGYDQKDWHHINTDQGIQSVRRAMVEHTEMRAQQLVEKYKDSKVFSNVIVAGLDPVRKKLNDFQFHDIDGHITRLKVELDKQIKKKQLELARAQQRVKQLQFPPEWDSMLAAFASSIRKYLDATYSATEPFEGLSGSSKTSEEDSLLWTTEEEARRVTKAAMDCNNSDGENEGLNWFEGKVDKKIVSLLTDCCGFEADMRIACLRSWQRLVDEFTGMLAFAPMPCVPASLHDMAKMRVGDGQSGQLNFTEETVRLVVSLGEGKQGGLVRPLLSQFERRVRQLVERDYRNATATIEGRCQVELERFYKLVCVEDPDDLAAAEEAARKAADRDGSIAPASSEDDARKRMEQKMKDIKNSLLSGVLKSLLVHADHVITSVLQGEVIMDPSGDIVVDTVTQRPRLRERSGIMVRVDENTTTPGPLHWMLPFKFNNSGQLHLRQLEYSERQLLKGNEGISWHRKVIKNRQGLLKSIGLSMSSCCEKQNEEDNGCPEVSWNRRLVEEIGVQFEDGTPTINCSNAVNLRIFRLCTEDYEVPMSSNASPHMYDVEVLKLLKALQFEMGAAWASMWRGMLQELTDRDKIKDWIQQHDTKEPVVQSMTLDGFDRQSTDSRRMERDPTLEAADAVCGWLSGSRALPGDMMTTEEEVKKAGEEAKWPDHSAFVEVLQKVNLQKVKTAFITNKDTKLAGQPSWLRLCDEFVFVILQLNMKRVSQEELSMVKASAGMMSAAGQQEMIAKLTLHRMSQLNMHSQKVFTKRFDFLFKRDVRTALTAIDGVAASLRGQRKNGNDASEWLENTLIKYKDHVINSTLVALQEKFEGLQPFDFAILNGRFPLNSQKLRRQHFELQDDGKSVKLIDATQEIKDMWTTPRYAQKQSVIVTPPDGRSSGVIQLETSGTLSAYGNLQEQRERVEQIFNLACSDPPAPGFAGGAFQELCLKFFKGIHVDAIHHCRPRLKAMMARMYQEEDLRRALQESGALDYLKDFGGHILDKQKNKVDSLRHKLRAMEACLAAANDAAEGTLPDVSPFACRKAALPVVVVVIFVDAVVVVSLGASSSYSLEEANLTSAPAQRPPLSPRLLSALRVL